MESDKQQNKNAHEQEGMSYKKNPFKEIIHTDLSALGASIGSFLFLILVNYFLVEEKFRMPDSLFILGTIIMTTNSLVFFAVFILTRRAVKREQVIKELKAKNQSFFEAIHLNMNHLIGKESKNAGPAIGSLE